MKRSKFNQVINMASKKLTREVKDDQCMENICSPITSLEDAWSYMSTPPQWIEKIVEIQPRSNFVVENSILPCHVESNKFSCTMRLNRKSTPRTLVCHDMKGGYIEDKFVNPTKTGNGYTFYRWCQIDIFVYFSHHLITIPPISWINAAHNNGVQILGTFITEWNPGKEICKNILKDNDTIMKFINVLVDICVSFKLDGWLLNIENEVDNIGALELFVRKLTEKIHSVRPGSLIIWYDSVTCEGKLKWQNELNDFNRYYFDNCDGIFLNYSWNEDNLKNSVKAAEHRCLDVYVGVDVFGRNFFGGGNFNTYLAVEKIRQYNLSMAIFAQGWTHETLNPEPSDTLLERFLIRDNAFWKSLRPFLYTHVINKPFETFFYVGVDKDWFKLHCQEIQLSHILESSEIIEEAADVPTLAVSCKCLQLHCQDPFTSCCVTNKLLDSNEKFVHRLFSCDIKISSKGIVYYYYKVLTDIDVNNYLDLVILVQNESGAVKKIICYSNKKSISLSNCSVLEENYTEDANVVQMVSKEHKVPADWILRCYVLELKNCSIIEIGATISSNTSVYLCGFGIKNYL